MEIEAIGLRDRIARVFRQHARELRREVRQAPPGWWVLAEVTNDGRWAGAGAVPPGTCSSLAHTGQGYAVFFRRNPEATLEDIEEAILDWGDQFVPGLLHAEVGEFEELA